MKKRLPRVTSMRQAEEIISAFLADLMSEKTLIVVQRSSDPYGWHSCEFRGKTVNVNLNGSIHVDSVALPVGVCCVLGNTLYRWMRRMALEQEQRTRAVFRKQNEKKLFRFAEELRRAR